MNIAVLGTGTVGRTLAGKLSELGHQVVVGTRDPQATLARTDAGAIGDPPYAAWQPDHPSVGPAFAEAAASGELVVNATGGESSLDALAQAGAATSPARCCWTSPIPWTSRRASRRPSS